MKKLGQPQLKDKIKEPIKEEPIEEDVIKSGGHTLKASASVSPIKQKEKSPAKEIKRFHSSVKLKGTHDSPKKLKLNTDASVTLMIPEAPIAVALIKEED